MVHAYLLSIIAALAVCVSAAAQEPAEEPLSEIDRMIQDGMAEALEARLHGGQTPDEKHQLARAYANKARRARQPDERTRAFQDAEDKYQRWVGALEPVAVAGDAAGVVRVAAARVEYAGMLLSGPAASGLDEYEISAGKWGDRAAIARWLTTAREQYEKAATALAPLVEEPARYEETLLAAGLFDTLVQAHLDATLNLGWTNYYLGMLASDETRRQEFLSAARHKFQELIDGGQTGAMRPQCYLGLGMVQREQGRLTDADKTLATARDSDADPAVAAHVRYELARCQIKGGKFDEARTTLRPLVEKDPENLGPEDRPARFYINLAQLWDGYSHLVEADAIRSEARDSPARTAIIQKAQRAREAGLVKLKRLTQRGGPWPALVQLYVAASIETQTPLSELGVVELLYSATALMDAQRYEEALARLEDAAARKQSDKELAGDVLFELGRCQHLRKNERGAAEAFAKLAAEYRGHAKAPQAATFAYQLWGQIAERSGAKGDYQQLAVVLQNLLASFADHPQRDEALWLLPMSLQLAGRFDEAAEEFGKVPQSSKHWEEAQYRREICRRLAVEAARASLPAEKFQAAARPVAEGLLRYADEALTRTAAAPNPKEVGQWSAGARLAAAELLVSPDVGGEREALAALASFETQYPQSELLGRVLALRMRAYRGLREFEQATRIVAQLLETAPPQQVGDTLTMLAAGMQDEVERLMESGRADEARVLAREALQTFDELAKWIGADAGRAQGLEPVRAGRTRMLYLAGEYEAAEQTLAKLLEKSPHSGNYQYLQAQILTARLSPTATPEELKRAQDAWAVLLSDAAIRQRAPQRYWESRYNWLALALRLGRAADVEKAITQERIWRPDLGGDAWKAKFEELLAAASQPASAPAGMKDKR
jgi:tetratricopeptide (TPR) repeat protein